MWENSDRLRISFSSTSTLVDYFPQFLFSLLMSVIVHFPNKVQKLLVHSNWVNTFLQWPEIDHILTYNETIIMVIHYSRINANHDSHKKMTNHELLQISEAGGRLFANHGESPQIYESRIKYWWLYTIPKSTRITIRTKNNKLQIITNLSLYAMHKFDRILNLWFAIKIRKKTVTNYEFPFFQRLCSWIMSYNFCSAC